MPSKAIDLNRKRIVLSRTDSIGDVVLSLPMAGLLKKHFPASHIIFLGRNYTKSVVALSKHVDEFVSWDDKDSVDKIQADILVHVFPIKEIAIWAKKQKISLRVGTTNRVYHWWTCNKLIKLSRKNSQLHESQLNLQLLKFLGIPVEISLKEMPQYYGFTRVPALDPNVLNWLSKDKKNIILHPKSKGSAREWGLDNFTNLINILPKESNKIFVSGTAEDGKNMQKWLAKQTDITDITGKLSLEQFIAFIYHADALIAASTGPLHIAAALGKQAIGLFAPMRPIHPGRWMPIGEKAEYLVLEKSCEDCRKTLDCHCIREIGAKEVMAVLEW